jgi:hypothetical protein
MAALFAYGIRALTIICIGDKGGEDERHEENHPSRRHAAPTIERSAFTVAKGG